MLYASSSLKQGESLRRHRAGDERAGLSRSLLRRRDDLRVARSSDERSKSLYLYVSEKYVCFRRGACLRTPDFATSFNPGRGR